MFAETLYQKPDAPIDQLVRGPDRSSPTLNRQKTALVKGYGVYYPSIQYIARPQIKLGGVRFNPKNYTSVANAYVKRLVYRDIKTKAEKEISFPEGSIIRERAWSPDGKHLAVSVELEKCHEVWIVQIPGLQKTKVPGVCLNAVLGRYVDWVDNDRLLLRVRTPDQAQEVAIEKEIPVGPVVQETKGKVSNNRTYPNLVKTPQDEKAFARAIKSQHVIYHVGAKSISKLGPAGLYTTFDFSPDRKYILVKTLQTPFSYNVPVGLYGYKLDVWTADGKPFHHLVEDEAQENLPIEGVTDKPRSFAWVMSEPSTLFNLKALDKGDWNVKADYRDELYFTKMKTASDTKAEFIQKFKFRIVGFDAFDLKDNYMVTEYERDRKWVTDYQMSKTTDGWKLKTMFSLSEDDDYNAPGSPYSKRNKYDEFVIAVDQTGDDASIYLSGKGSTPKGDFPFLKKMSLETQKTSEIFRSAEGRYESFQGFMDTEHYTSFLISSESQTEMQKYELVTVKDGKLSREVFLDSEPDIFQKIAQFKKEIVTYKRNDGVLLSGTLYYPTDYKEGQKYPAIIQAYPLEYTDASTAGQVRGSQNYYSRPSGSSILFNLMRGYVVLDEAQMPIIGPPETKNDTFREQLVAGAQAAVDFLKQKGLVDEKRIGVIGHSYGAFMVSNLLTYSDLFATGIARSGAYNRTLTPNGFQGERRSLWQAKETYAKMSPFIDADKMKKPLLLIHGMADNNPGTFTLQSERYFDALKAQGVTARLVLLPEESHGYESLESNEHVLYETFRWFDQYLKN